MTNLSLFANHYRKLGLPITRISNTLNEHNFYHKNLLKTPDHAWEHLFAQPQSEAEFMGLTWNAATGLGTVTGLNGLLVIDIDGCTDYKLLNKTLAELGLPISYEWVVTSGNGFHIYVYADKFHVQPDEKGQPVGELVVTTFMPNDGYLQRFDKTEFLWKTHVVLPPSLHHTGNRYEFLNCRLPRAMPQRVKQSGLYDIVRKHCEADFIEGRNGYQENDFQIVDPKVPTDLIDWNAANVEGHELFCVVCLRLNENEVISTDAAPQQIAWVVMDTVGRIHTRRSFLIESEATQLQSIAKNRPASAHEHLTQEFLTALKELNRDLRFCTVLVSFDVQPVSELLHEQFVKYSLYSTLTQLRLICLKNPRRGKPAATLADLYLNLFRYDVYQIPDAESDALIMAKCLRLLVKNRQQQGLHQDSIYCYDERYDDYY